MPRTLPVARRGPPEGEGCRTPDRARVMLDVEGLDSRETVWRMRRQRPPLRVAHRRCEYAEAYGAVGARWGESESAAAQHALERTRFPIRARCGSSV
jgi:hypothetical protein